MTFFHAMEWHEGEQRMHKALHTPETDNPTVPMLSPQASNMLQRAPLLAIGTLDSESRPWTSLWGGDPGFSRPLGQSMIGISTPVAAHLDPVIEELVGKKVDGEVVKAEVQGKMIGALSIDLETRKRVKLCGRMVIGALGHRRGDDGSAAPEHDGQGEIQLVVKIDQSLGNCPKYLNKKHIVPVATAPILLSESTTLTQEAIDLVHKADLFFVSSRNSTTDMDVNHRGGPPGFARVLSNDSSSTTLVWPEYSGNRLYQTLGNLFVTPQAGLCFPDFDTGDALYLTGTTDVLIGADAADLLPRSNLAVKLTVTAARYVAAVLPFKGIPGEPSPYNPSIRYLKAEQKPALPTDGKLSNTAKLQHQTILTPTISRFTFSLQNAATYTAGQYVTFDFSDHLNIGYSHMRDDDPRSLNDDFVRTFTVSSPPSPYPRPSISLKDDESEITIRRVGVVTDFLFKHGLANSRHALEVDIKGFGGAFEVQQEEQETVAFVGAGVGITPLLSSLHSLDFRRLKVLWTVRREDVGVAVDVLKQQPKLGDSLSLFITGQGNVDGADIARLQHVKAAGVAVFERRLQQDDVVGLSDVHRWYLCTATPLRKVLLDWLPGKETIYEDFSF